MKASDAELRNLQQSMESAAGESFSAAEIEALRVLIRITLESHMVMQNKSSSSSLIYQAASVFSGIDSFMSATHAFAVLKGTNLASQIHWDGLSLASLTSEFSRLYEHFLAEKGFESRLRLLLDLYKLQIAFAGVVYDCRSE